MFCSLARVVYLLLLCFVCLAASPRLFDRRRRFFFRGLSGGDLFALGGSSTDGSGGLFLFLRLFFCDLGIFGLFFGLLSFTSPFCFFLYGLFLCGLKNKYGFSPSIRT
jgi:hypothetical protein